MKAMKAIELLLNCTAAILLCGVMIKLLMIGL